MHVNTIVRRLTAQEACRLIEFLDQLRAVLIMTYGDDVKVMLRETSQRESSDQSAAGF